MIQFFRRIRQKLVADGNLYKYLLYAIGEIALVMIGILLALQVNTWSQQRNDRIQETAYLKALKSDIEFNLDQFDHYKQLLKIKVDVLNRILNGTYDKIRRDTIESKIASVEGSYDIFFSRYSFLLPIQNNTFQEMLSNGGISLVQSEKLRSEIFLYYSYLEERVEIADSNVSEWPNIVSSLISGKHYDTGIFTNSQASFSTEGQNLLVQRLRTNLDSYAPIINMEIQFSSRVHVIISDLEKQANAMSDLLADELKHRN